MNFKEVDEKIRETFHKKVDRLYWRHKYLMALAEIENIEGMIGLRKKDKVEIVCKKCDKRVTECVCGFGGNTLKEGKEQ